MWLFLKRFPDADMYESVCMLFGNKFGKLLGFAYVLFYPYRYDGHVKCL